MQFQGYFTVEELIGRGWLPGTISALLTRPDKALRGGEDVMDLFRESRIIDLESGPRFRKIQAQGELTNSPPSDTIALALGDLRPVVLSRSDLRRAAVQRFNLKKGLPATQQRLLTTEAEYGRMEVDFLLVELGRTFKIGDRREIDVRESPDEQGLLHRIASLYPHLRAECEGRRK